VVRGFKGSRARRNLSTPKRSRRVGAGTRKVAPTFGRLRECCAATRCGCVAATEPSNQQPTPASTPRPSTASLPRAPLARPSPAPTQPSTHRGSSPAAPSLWPFFRPRPRHYHLPRGAIYLAPHAHRQTTHGETTQSSQGLPQTLRAARASPRPTHSPAAGHLHFYARQRWRGKYETQRARLRVGVRNRRLSGRDSNIGQPRQAQKNLDYHSVFRSTRRRWARLPTQDQVSDRLSY